MTTEFQVVSVSPQIIKKKARVFGKGGIRCHICHRSQGGRIRGIAEWPPVPWIQQYQFCESPRVEHPPDPSRDRLGAAGRPGGLAFSGSERQILGRPGQWCWIGRSAPHCGVVLLVFRGIGPGCAGCSHTKYFSKVCSCCASPSRYLPLVALSWFFGYYRAKNASRELSFGIVDPSLRVARAIYRATKRYRLRSIAIVIV